MEAIIAVFGNILNTRGQRAITDKFIKPAVAKFPYPFNVQGIIAGYGSNGKDL